MKAKKLFHLLAVFCILALVLCAVACGGTEDPAPTPDPDDNGGTPPTPETLTYTVTLLDGNGNQMSDVIVKILKEDGEQLKMLVYKGATVTFEAEPATYTVELDLAQLNGSYAYDRTQCTLTAASPSTTLRLYLQSTESESVFVGAPISQDYVAQHVSLGSYMLSITPNDYTFLIFRPTVAAVYTITYECGTELTVSYHGSTHFVQGSDLTEGAKDLARYENGISINVYESNLGGEFVFAVKSTSAESCILHIKNAGDPGTRLEEQPWTPYTEDPSKVAQHLQIAANAAETGTWNTVDLTDMDLRAFYNENDGFYHMGGVDGPILYIDLTSESAYIGSVQAICANQRMGIYVYDDAGNVIEKRSFNELFLQYGMPSDDTAPENGPVRVPLTQKLATAIQSFGEKSDWWTPGSSNNIFSITLSGMGYNQAFAWLLFCGYYA